MRISRRTSGGRGEYEISEQDLASGLQPPDLFELDITLQLGERVIVSGLVLRHQGGKRRLRSKQRRPRALMVQRQVAAALLLPHPVRADEALGRGEPVVRENEYAIEHLEVTQAERRAGGVLLVLGNLEVKNRSYEGVMLSIGDRMLQVEELWERRSELPDALSDILESHQHSVDRGLISAFDEDYVTALQSVLAEHGGDLDAPYASPSEDAVPTLLAVLNSSVGPSPPELSPEVIDPENLAIMKRVVGEWKRWARHRGAAGARFRFAVREAYRSTCLICGIRLPATAANAMPGVDAAHIIPWSQYDLDETRNGICLCRFHHWAFDEGLVRVRFTSPRYEVYVPQSVRDALAEAEEFSMLESLLRAEGRVPPDRLPVKPEDRPCPRLLSDFEEHLL